MIAPIYRRVTDELLVELHLLNHQKEFSVNNIFAVGLIRVFNDFMQGYKPNEHLDLLFNALCKCNELDAEDIKTRADKTLREISNNSIQSIENTLGNDRDKSSVNLSNIMPEIKTSNLLYCRLSVIGLLTVLKEANDSNSFNSEVLLDKTKQICGKIGYSKTRVEKDLTTYRSNLEKINQALELIKEGIEREKRKKDERSKGNH